MKKKVIAFFLSLVLCIGFSNMNINAAEEYAWVLVDTHYYPIPAAYSEEWYYGNISNNSIEIKTAWAYGLGAYGSKDYNNPTNMHGKYTWTTPPSIIKPKEKVNIKFSQEVISNRNGNYSLGYSGFMDLDAADMELGYATSSIVRAKAYYKDGTLVKHLGMGTHDDAKAQVSFTADLILEFRDKGSEGAKCALYVGVYGGSPGSLGVRYTYEWKKVTATVKTNSVDTFESGIRIMWSPVNCLGYRVFRSTTPSSLGISVTDFYITSTSFADVNVEPNTNYYYTVKPVLAEANPYQGISEKLGDTIGTFTAKTGSNIKDNNKLKHFIILKLNDINMSVDGLIQEVDPGRKTAPITVSGRTMVPIRAIVEAMGGTVEWDGNTKLITLKARGNTVLMWLDKTNIVVNGVNKKMDVAPVSKNGRTFVPVRFGAENLNCSVDWINSTKEAVIVYEE